MEGREQNRQFLEQEIRGLKDLLSVAQVVVSSLDLDEVLQNILGSAMAIMDMPAGSIALYEESRNEMTLHAHSGLSKAFVARSTWLVSKGGLTDRILSEGEPFVVEDTGTAVFFNNPLAIQEGIRSLICVPLKIQNKVLGVLYLDAFEPRRFSRERLQLLSVLASFAAMSVDNACLHQRAQRLACTDGLTGLYNHRQFKKMLKDEMLRARRHNKPLALVMFDVDNFKQFNDTYGHPNGDKALLAVTGILESALRECDLVFRYGGEEFIAILPETIIDDAIVAAERARSAVEKETPGLLGEFAACGLTVSAGVACYPIDGKDPDALMGTVDELLYKAKHEGKNKVYYVS
ncbi:GGDEF domain-containing protein [Desulfuromonas versatilis]|uniref:diguanylate cyclase n=1 Tax=Desulfuromonas versatilis TaxID=2802975 RepID=A0ABM8HXC1_9BACT|nr:sensor domain-containing diguanylate cyclase [Desulfuromonas versatilis]BCR05348.1 GGDEF domain-containing protein [Desulfuromonas versatilis]